MIAVRRLTTLLCLSLFATSVLAQTPETTVRRTTEAVTAETDRDVNDPRALKLSLQEALRTAMQRNLGVELQSYDYRMSGHSLRSQYTLYDWFGQATIEHGEAEGATISQTEPTSSGVTRANFGVAQNLPAGGNYFLGLNSNRQTTVGGFTDVSPAYRPALIFAATQPLARNFGIDVTR